MYGPGHVAALVVLGVVLVPFISAIVLWYAHKRSNHRETTRSRAYLFYRALSGVLLGQFLCHTWVPVALGNLDVRLLFICTLVGYLCMDAAEALLRIWQDNRNYVALVDDTPASLEDATLNKTQMAESEVVVLSNLSSADFAAQSWTLQDKRSEEHKRQWMLAALIFTLSIMATTDGLLLIALAPTADQDVLLICWYIHAVAMSMAVFGGMVHAKFHLIATRRERWFWWWLVAGAWWSIVVLVLAVGLPQWTSMAATMANAIIAHPAFLVIYGVAAGLVLKLQQYYYNRRLDPKTTTKRDIGLGLLVFWLSAGQAAVTGFWL